MDYNPYLVVPFATWAITQIAKFAISALRGNIDLKNLYASGGMPSVHSAVVISLATTAFLLDGGSSHIFGLTAVLAAIVMYDSFGVRRSSGEQAAAINGLVQSLERGKFRFDAPQSRLREVLGHKPREVVVGALLGLVLGLVFNFDRITPLVTFLTASPVLTEQIIYAAVFVVLIIGGFVQRGVLRRRFKRSATLNRLTRRILVATQTTGWIGLALGVLAYERASYMGWRLWSLVVLAAIVIWAVGIIYASRGVRAGLEREAGIARKLKWLKRNPKRKKK